MGIRAVLFDVGGPLDTEVTYETLIDQHMLEALALARRPVTAAEFAEANRRAVESFAPNTYLAIIWTLTDGDPTLAAEVYGAVAARRGERHVATGGLELRPGIPELLRELDRMGLLLGLVANQPAAKIADLDRYGIGRYFRHREVAGHHGYSKPDVRIFLRACEDLVVAPEECIMVGDRVDNDIVPAQLLGMRTVLLRAGRHIDQQPRSPDEVPDAEVSDVSKMREAILELAGLT